ncbi:MAG: type II toxin-antitoxin system VapC family toxin [Fibrobacter sp.]|mgnify:CR=1 FL=1|nr:type II toxin-antitoxin system VapC family toxin [Fibrobacter sp.]
MVLVDTSVWVNHLNRSDRALIELLNNAQVAVHPFVLGELACGNIRNRTQILSLLMNLPSVPVVSGDEFFFFIEKKSLSGKGLGFVDIHLLASAAISETAVYTKDKQLYLASKNLGFITL